MDFISYQSIMKHLHQLMKTQKLTYNHLSVIIKRPESTIKKWFLSKDGSLHRINLICQALGVHLEDVLNALNQQKIKTFIMGKKQQEHFNNNFLSFKVYWLLVYERRTALEIQQLLKIDENVLRKHFLQLDQLNLIKVDLKEKAKPPKVTPIRWSAEGVFMQKIFREWSLGIIKQSLLSKKSSDLLLQYFQISEKSEMELRKDLIALEEKYARQTIQDIQMGEALKKIRFVTALAEGSFL